MSSQVPLVNVTDGAQLQPAAPVALFGKTYQLATALNLGANAASAPVDSVRGSTYVLDAQWTGAGTLKLQALGADGVTWRDVYSMSAPGTAPGEIRVGSNATLRLFNANAAGGATLANLYVSLS